MIESAATRISQSPFVKSVLGVVNRIPFPYDRIPVTVHGHRMVARTLDRFLALWFWKFGIFGAAEVKLLGRLCREGMTVLDIGANIGFHTLLFARAVGPSGRVWAFEPDTGNFGTLRRNLALNPYGNVTAVQAGVGATSGTAFLYRSPFQFDHRTYRTHDGQQGLPVEVVSLDEFLPPGQRVDLVKMDIQGAEGTALRGMKRTIASNPRLAILMEFWPEGLREAGCSPETVLSELEEIGFSFYRIDERTGGLGRVHDRAAFVGTLTGSGYANILAVPGSDKGESVAG